ncbi:hypothetical protein ABIE91_009579 [Bradyrhizobium elkanii]
MRIGVDKMGYNATVVVLVDQLDRIEKTPDFGKQLADAIRAKLNDPSERHISAPYVAGQTQVIETHHADHMMVVAVGGNTGQILGWGGGYRSDPDEMIKWLNADRLRRKREAKNQPEPREARP